MTNLEEYRGFMWGPPLVRKPAQEPSVYARYQTDAFVPEGGAEHFRTNPMRKDLFVKVTGFDFNVGNTDNGYDVASKDCPFALGAAFSDAGVDVHAVSADFLPLFMRTDIQNGVATGIESWEKYTDAGGVVRNMIQAVLVTNKLDRPMSSTDGHINKEKGVRNWSWDTKGWSGVGDAVTYGAGTTIYWVSLWNYFVDSPFADRPPGQSGWLDPISAVQDKNDNGTNDLIGQGPNAYWESGCQGCPLQGDLYCLGSYSQDLTTFDIDQDGFVGRPGDCRRPLNWNRNWLAQWIHHCEVWPAFTRRHPRNAILLAGGCFGAALGREFLFGVCKKHILFSIAGWQDRRIPSHADGLADHHYHTRLGAAKPPSVWRTHLILIGDNINSAEMMGVNTRRVRTQAFMLIGLISAFAGVIASFYVAYLWPSLGDGYLLRTLASVFLGGTSVFGGVGTILGTFIGAFIIGTIEAATVAAGLTGFWTNLMYGFIIVVSVIMHSYLRKRAE